MAAVAGAAADAKEKDAALRRLDGDERVGNALDRIGVELLCNFYRFRKMLFCIGHVASILSK